MIPAPRKYSIPLPHVDRAIAIEKILVMFSRADPCRYLRASGAEDVGKSEVDALDVALPLEAKSR